MNYSVLTLLLLFGQDTDQELKNQLNTGFLTKDETVMKT